MVVRWVAAGVLEAVKGFRLPLDAIVAAGAFYEVAISEDGRRTRNGARVTAEPPLNFNSRRDIPKK